MNLPFIDYSFNNPTIDDADDYDECFPDKRLAISTISI